MAVPNLPPGFDFTDPELTPVSEPQRQRSSFINGIKHGEVEYR